MNRRLIGFGALAAIGAAAVALIAVELGKGALDFGNSETKDACTAESTFPGDGLDATVQRVVLSGLYGAACELGTSREELILSFAPSVGTEEIEWDEATIERAVRSGLLKAIADAEARGSIGDVTALVLRELVERAPLDFLIGSGTAIADVVRAVQDGSLGDLLDRADLGELEDLLDGLDLGGLVDRVRDALGLDG